MCDPDVYGFLDPTLKPLGFNFQNVGSWFSFPLLILVVLIPFVPKSDASGILSDSSNTESVWIMSVCDYHGQSILNQLYPIELYMGKAM